MQRNSVPKTPFIQRAPAGGNLESRREESNRAALSVV